MGIASLQAQSEMATHWQFVEIRRGRRSGKARSGEKAECMG
jgi:hypothetical protein